MDNVSQRPVCGHGVFATTDCSWTGTYVGQQNLFCSAVTSLPSGWFVEETTLDGQLHRSERMRSNTRISHTLRRFTRSCGDLLAGNYHLFLAVGGERRAATDSDV